jgi:hypothetical protein
MIKRLINNKSGILFLVFLVSLPVMFVNRQISTDWGGDFAMYINEAANIASFHQVNETSYVYNEQAPMLGPSYYPVGFPLLLSPVYFLFGNNISAFILYISFLLVLSAVVLQLFFQNFFSKTVSFILVLVIIYNPWTLNFKNEILADIPFMLFFVLTLVLYFKKAPVWLTGMAMGFTILIKTAGYVLPAAFFVYYFYLFFSARKPEKPAKSTLLYPAVFSIAMVFIVNKLIFRLPPVTETYFNNFEIKNLFHNFLLNIALYIQIFQSFFFRNLHDWQFVVLITQSAMLTFLLIGLLNAKKNLTLFLVFVYLVLLLVYPYKSSGFRFLFPLLPLLLVFSVEGFKSIKWNFKTKTHIVIIFASVFLLGQYIPGIVNLAKNNPGILPGPQENSSLQMFGFIKQHIENKKVILFSKPRVLALYTGRKSVCNNFSDDDKKIDLLIRNKHINYILINKDLDNPAINNYIEKNTGKMKLIWKNEKFKFFELLPNHS